MPDLADKVEITHSIIQDYKLSKNTVLHMIKNNGSTDQVLIDSLNFAFLLTYYDTISPSPIRLNGDTEKHRSMKMIGSFGNGPDIAYVFIDKLGYLFSALSEVTYPSIDKNDHRHCFLFRGIEYFSDIHHLSLLVLHHTFETTFIIQNPNILYEFKARTIVPISKVGSIQFLGEGT